MKIIKKSLKLLFSNFKKVYFCKQNKYLCVVYPKRVNTVKRLHGKNFKWEAIWC